MLEIKHRILGNGFKIIYVPEKSNPMVSMHLFVRTGSAWEKENESGFSHLAEHLVFRSTKSYPEGSLSERTAFLGGTINAYTEYDSTCFFITLPCEYSKEALKMLIELVRFPTFSEAEFNAEKQVVLEEIAEVENDPEESMLESICAVYLQKNPYSRPIAGDSATLKKAEYKDLKDFIAANYLPGMCYLVCAGDFDEKDINEQIDSLLSDWQASAVPYRKPCLKEFPASFSFHNLIHRNKADILAVAVPDLAVTDADSYALSLVYKVLFIGSRSLMHRELYMKRQLIEMIRLQSITGINDGLSIVTIFPKQGVSAEEVLAAFFQVLENFKLRGISASELQHQQAELINSYKYSFEYIENLASSLGNEEIYSDYNRFLKYPKLIKTISRLQVRKIIDHWLDYNKFKVFYQGQKHIDADFVRSMFQVSQKTKFTSSHGRFYEKVLENGLHLLLHRIKGKPATGASLCFDVSQLNERQGQRGINYLTSSLLLYGSESMDYQQTQDFCSLHGINISVNQVPELSKIRGKCFTEDLPLLLERLADLAFYPQLPRKHFLNLKKSIISLLRRYTDYPQKQAFMVWQNQIFGRKSLLINTEGKKSDLNQLTLAQADLWHRKYYTPDNMKLVVTGELDFPVTIDLVEKYFNRNTIKIPKESRDYSIFPARRRVQKKDSGSSQAVIILGGYTAGYDNIKDTIALYFLTAILGGDTNSRLFIELREKRGLAYSVYMDSSVWREFGVYTVQAVVDKKNASLTLSLILQELHKLRRNGISSYELEKTRNHILGQFLQEQESASLVAESLATALSIGRSYEHYLNRKQRLMSIKVNDIQELAEKLFASEDFFITISS